MIQSNNNSKPFENPWPFPGDYDPERQQTLQVDIPIAEKLFLQQLSPKKGTIQTTINILLNELFAQLRSKNITTIADSHEFEQFVANCRIVDGRNGSTPSRTVRKTNAPNVGRGVKRAGAENTKLSK